ncbi:MAG: hypothetical protein FRX49_07755 [Trebouxia sp. A1-2]|nr:MAG: hypothetical protein FRX49_07755 [Trebouxia sp. A1-2]
MWTGPAAGAAPQQQPDLALATARLRHTHLAETAGHHQQHEEMRASECSLRADEAGTHSASVTVYGWSPMGFVPAQAVAGKADLEALKWLAGKGEMELKGAGKTEPEAGTGFEADTGTQMAMGAEAEDPEQQPPVVQPLIATPSAHLAPLPADSPRQTALLLLEETAAEAALEVEQEAEVLSQQVVVGDVR